MGKLFFNVFRDFITVPRSSIFIIHGIVAVLKISVISSAALFQALPIKFMFSIGIIILILRVIPAVT